MSSEIKFGYAKVKTDNTKPEVDKDGFYRVRLGAVNAFNENGDFYLEEGIKDLVENQNHTLARRLKGGYLKGEAGHPVFQPGLMSKAQFYARNLRIEITRVSHTIREIIFVPSDKEEIPGKGKLVYIEAWIKPTGQYGEALKKDLDDPNINVAFSIRSFTKDDDSSGINFKRFVQIVTWDWVIEPGIKDANKWAHLSTEDIMTFTIDELMDEEGKVSACYNCSFESKDEQSITSEIIDSMKTGSSSNKIYDW